MATRRLVRWLDQRTGAASTTAKALEKVFPNHWSFLLGEVALYSFLILVLTGIYLGFFYVPSVSPVTYEGSYEPLRGVEVSEAYHSAMDLSFDVRAGLVMRQMHHWAALVFVAAIVAHLARIFFTGAFRRPRELNWMVGVTLMLLAILNGFAGYSLLDDQLSGTGLRIMYSVIISIPVAGTWMASLLFGGDFPGDDILNRLFLIHVFVVPIAIAALLVLHIGMLVKHKHTHFAGHGATDGNVVGERLWPTYAAKAGSMFFFVGAVIAALGGLAQINAIWVYGPFRPANVSALSQPDWYMGWLEGAMRLMPAWEARFAGYTVPNPFFPGVLVPGVTFALLYAWPLLEAWRTGDRAEHHVLERPRDRPGRTAAGVATLAFYGVLGLGGANDLITTFFGFSLNQVVWILRGMLVVVPPVAALLAHRLCTELQARDAAPGAGGGPGAAGPGPRPVQGRPPAGVGSPAGH
jgi:ubiquinol-cytochrome c reductase cytochrome b subunit